MNFPSRAIVFIVIALIFTGCNTMYNSRLIKLDILEPAKVYFPSNIKSVAFRYNNVNVSYNASFAEYLIIDKILNDSLNMDSVLSFIYFNTLTEGLRANRFFDSIYILPPGNYTNTQFVVLPPKEELLPPKMKLLEPKKVMDLNQKNEVSASQKSISFLIDWLKQFNPGRNQFSNKKIIHPVFGLYTKGELSKIRKSTGADILFSLDYFATTDWINSPFSSKYNIPETKVIVYTIFNSYNLETDSLVYFDIVSDTINVQSSLSADARSSDIELIRSYFLINAVRSSAQNMVDFLIPHWINVDRTVYYSYKKKIKPASDFINTNNWEKAVAIWEQNKTHKNKRIKAQCLYNLGVSKEIEGDFKKAIEFISQSYSVFGNKNIIHEFNCMDYLKILQQRKRDAKLIDFQINPK